jgi:hypothetical protein
MNIQPQTIIPRLVSEFGYSEKEAEKSFRTYKTALPRYKKLLKNGGEEKA